MIVKFHNIDMVFFIDSFAHNSLVHYMGIQISKKFHRK